MFEVLNAARKVIGTATSNTIIKPEESRKISTSISCVGIAAGMRITVFDDAGNVIAEASEDI